jgi:hypothetical protein
MYREVVEMGVGASIISPSLLLNVEEIIAAIEGIGSITPITEAGRSGSGRSALCWKNGSGIWRPRYPKLSRQRYILSVALNSHVYT